MADRYKPLSERFWPRVEKTETCWNWTGRKQGSGYGAIELDRRSLLAHRVAFELTVGPIPEGLTLDHLCMNKLCVNPAHLEPVTASENVKRWARSVTHCPQGHEYTAENTRTYRGRRSCITCNRDRSRLYGRAKRAAKHAGEQS
jgi:hypothetical protein